jgi:carbamoyltransferase
VDPHHPGTRDRIDGMAKRKRGISSIRSRSYPASGSNVVQYSAGVEFPYYDHECECSRGISFTIASRGLCRRFSEVTVSSADNSEFHSLLEAFGCLTGQEIVLNTSFNVKGQLFVNTPESGGRNLPWLWH